MSTDSDIQRKMLERINERQKQSFEGQIMNMSRELSESMMQVARALATYHEEGAYWHAVGMGGKEHQVGFSATMQGLKDQAETIAKMVTDVQTVCGVYEPRKPPQKATNPDAIDPSAQVQDPLQS